MYSAVLMLAVMAGGDSVDHGGRNRCTGCSGVVVCSSSGVGCSRGVVVGGGCSTSCSHGRSHGGLFNRGCSTGCTGAVACSTSCSRGGLFGGHRNRCCGTVVTCASSVGCAGGTVIVPAKKDMPKGEPIPDPKKKTVSVPATIVVSLPADARLIVDGNATTSTSEVRTLVTPALEVGQTYVYTMRAEVVREGRTVEETHVVNVFGGQTTNVRFAFPQSVASR